jgi:hypothetical protein
MTRVKGQYRGPMGVRAVPRVAGREGDLDRGDLAGANVRAKNASCNRSSIEMT